MSLSHLQYVWPFWLHVLVELPASLNFFLRPSEQLRTPAPQAHDVIRQYAVLLFSSNLVALVFILRPVDGTSAKVAGALAVYHLAPLVRSSSRVRRGDGGYGTALGGPLVHLVVHGLCLAGLANIFARQLFPGTSL